MSYTKARREKTKDKVFWVVSKKEPNAGELQGILYTDGTVDVGIDAWRLMNKADFPSYPIKHYVNISVMKKDYRFIKIRKPYYFNRKEETHGCLL